MSPVDLERLARQLRSREVQRIDDPEARRAAVAGVFRVTPDERVEVLLIRRAERPGDHWSGHMAFPGGRREPHDPDLLATATRETLEEVGLDLGASGELLGPLDEILPRNRTGLVVSPFAFRLSGAAELRPNHEVAEALWTDVGPLIRGEVDDEHPLDWQGQHFRFPAYRVGGHLVWGMTYRVLKSMFELLE